MHSGMSADPFLLSDKEAQRHWSGGSSKTGFVECNYSEFDITNISHIDVLTLLSRHVFRYEAWRRDERPSV